MSGFEQMLALIDEGHGYYDIDDGFNNDIIGLHAANINDSYKLNNVLTNEPKTTISKPLDELESKDPNIMKAEPEDSTELIPIYIQEKEQAISNNKDTNQYIPQPKMGVRVHDLLNNTNEEVNQIQDQDFYSGRN